MRHTSSVRDTSEVYEPVNIACLYLCMVKVPCPEASTAAAGGGQDKMSGALDPRVALAGMEGSLTTAATLHSSNWAKASRFCDWMPASGSSESVKPPA